MRCGYFHVPNSHSHGNARKYATNVSGDTHATNQFVQIEITDTWLDSLYGASYRDQIGGESVALVLEEIPMRVESADLHSIPASGCSLRSYVYIELAHPRS